MIYIHLTLLLSGALVPRMNSLDDISSTTPEVIEIIQQDSEQVSKPTSSKFLCHGIQLADVVKLLW